MRVFAEPSVTVSVPCTRFVTGVVVFTGVVVTGVATVPVTVTPLLNVSPGLSARLPGTGSERYDFSTEVE